MNIFNSPIEKLPYESTVVTVGTFDGVHKGHQNIIEKVKSVSRELGAASVLVTFEPHPKLVVQNSRPPIQLLTSMNEKAAVLDKLGIDALVISKFTPEFASTPAADFVCDTLVKKLNMRSIIIGHDHAFGRNREGNESLLKKLGVELDFQVHAVKPIKINDGIISSTRIRRALSEGKIELSNKLLGRAYSLCGKIVKGRKQGRKLGFPTANILPSESDKLIPKAGIYATTAQLEGTAYKSVTYIGVRPTFKGDDLVVEVHLDNLDKDIYGKELIVYFHRFLRKDKKFTSKDELVKSIKQDKINAIKFLDNGGNY